MNIHIMMFGIKCKYYSIIVAVCLFLVPLKIETDELARIKMTLAAENTKTEFAEIFAHVPHNGFGKGDDEFWRKKSESITIICAYKNVESDSPAIYEMPMVTGFSETVKSNHIAALVRCPQKNNIAIKTFLIYTGIKKQVE